MPSRVDKEQLLPIINSLQMDIDNWYASSQAELNAFQRKINERIDRLRRQGNGNWSPAAEREAASSNVPSTPPPRGRSAAEDVADADWSILGQREANTATPHHHDASSLGMTPTGSPQSNDRMPLEQLLARISAASNAPPLNFDTLYEQLAGDGNSPPQQAQDSKPNQSIPMDRLMHMQGQAQTAAVHLSRPADGGRPTVLAVDGANAAEDDPKRYNIDPNAPCQALVEFKRKRVLQYDSRQYVAPGEYVIVGGDRGEDLGLVIYTWCETQAGKVQGIGLTGSSLTRSIGVGSGKVLRVATPFEVSQLHGIQTELERRAIDVCQQRVLDHALPMVIVDAEYQFDNKKLTFFYEAQQRLDFRELVRDLFKTFRARIWMELAVRD